MLLSPPANSQLMETFYAVVMKQEIWNQLNYDAADELIDLEHARTCWTPVTCWR